MPETINTPDEARAELRRLAHLGWNKTVMDAAKGLTVHAIVELAKKTQPPRKAKAQCA